MSTDVAAALARTHREEWTRVVAGLVRRFRDLDIAEEAAAEAFAVAVQRWPVDGVPPQPGAWITTTAHRRAIDRPRREARRDERAFLVQESTMAQRLTRAKARIRAAGVPFRVPEPEDLPARAAGVLAVLYLIFNEGYLASGAGADPLRPDLSAEAIRLTRLVRDLFPPDSAERAETTGLLALMLLTEARAAARVSGDGQLVPLDEQDRAGWDRALIDEGLALVDERFAAVERGTARLDRYQLLAAVNAVYASAPHADDTDWDRIVALYGALERIDPNPLVTLNRAIAISEADSPRAGLAIVDGLADALDGHHAFHATRAELLRRLGRTAEAIDAYDRAIALAENPGEVAILIRRRAKLAASAPAAEHREAEPHREGEPS